MSRRDEGTKQVVLQLGVVQAAKLDLLMKTENRRMGDIIEELIDQRYGERYWDVVNWTQALAEGLYVLPACEGGEV